MGPTMSVPNAITSVTIGLPVPDLEAAKAWYRDLLGERSELAPAPGVFEIEILPGTWLQLLESERKGAADGILRLGTDDIEQEHARVQEGGGHPTAIQTVPGMVRYFEFADPYGNRLSFYQVLGAS